MHFIFYINTSDACGATRLKIQESSCWKVAVVSLKISAAIRVSSYIIVGFCAVLCDPQVQALFDCFYNLKLVVALSVFDAVRSLSVHTVLCSFGLRNALCRDSFID